MNTLNVIAAATVKAPVIDYKGIANRGEIPL